MGSIPATGAPVASAAATDTAAVWHWFGAEEYVAGVSGSTTCASADVAVSVTSNFTMFPHRSSVIDATNETSSTAAVELTVNVDAGTKNENNA